MLLPQSSAFVSLRNRLGAVSSMGFLHIAPRASFSSNVATARSKMAGRDEIKWQELLVHFRKIQDRHEKVRRQAQLGEANHNHTLSGFHYTNTNASSSSNSNSPLNVATAASGSLGYSYGNASTRRRNNPGVGSRKDSGQSSASAKIASTLSPLNPNKRTGSGGHLALPAINTVASGASAQGGVGARRLLPGMKK